MPRTVGQRQVLQRALADRLGVRAVLARRLVGVVLGPQLGAQAGADVGAHELARQVDRERVDGVELVGDHRFRGQQQRLFAEGRVERLVDEDLAHRLDEHVVQVEARRHVRAVVPAGHVPASAAGGSSPGAGRFPAVDGVAVVAEQVQQFGVVVAVFQDHRRGKVAQDRRRRLSGTPVNTKVWSASVSSSTAVVPPAAVDDERQVAPVLPSRPTATGMWNGSFSGWPGVAGQDCDRRSV